MSDIIDPLAWLSRTELILGRENLELLAQKHVIVIGLGGVGSFAAELICRGGVGKMTIVDGDAVDLSNCNRQLPAMSTTVGQYKADIMAERIRSINPNIELTVIKEFLSPERIDELLSTPYDYLVDAIDSITPKLRVIKYAYERRIPFVSSMGAGGKIDPTRVRIVDISKTKNCALAQHIRKCLKRKGISKGFKVVYSAELPMRESLMYTDGSNFKKSAYGTVSYMPAVFGCCCAGAVLRGLLRKKGEPLDIGGEDNG
jgi:tRNA A37 threonylcarbamoyladenosine dehydratase